MSENNTSIGEVKEQTGQTDAESVNAAPEDAVNMAETAAAEPAKKKNSKAKVLVPIIAAAVILAGAAGCCAYQVYRNNYEAAALTEQKYQEAIELCTQEKYEEAVVILDELGDYQEAIEWKENARQEIELGKAYAEAEKLLADEKYQEAYDAFTELDNYMYKDSRDKAKEIYKAHLSLIARIRGADIGDEVRIYLENSGPKWRVLAKEDNKVLLYESFSDYNSDQWGEILSGLDPNFMYNFDDDIRYKKYIDPEIRNYMVKPGPFVPHMSLYDQYIKNSGAFVADSRTWVVAYGSGHQSTDMGYVYLPRFIGPDNEVYKHGAPGRVFYRYFVWIDISE